MAKTPSSEKEKRFRKVTPEYSIGFDGYFGDIVVTAIFSMLGGMAINYGIYFRDMLSYSLGFLLIFGWLCVVVLWAEHKRSKLEYYVEVDGDSKHEHVYGEAY